MPFELQVESEVDVERERVEIFRRRVDGRIEIFGQYSVLFAQRKFYGTEFESDIYGVYLKIEIEFIIVLPSKRNITVVRIEFDESFGIDLLACEHLHEGCNKSFGKVDLYAFGVQTDVTYDAAEHFAENAHKVDSAALVCRCGCRVVAAARVVGHQTADQRAEIDVGERKVEIVAQIEIDRAYRLTLRVFTRALQTQCEDNVFEFFGVGHLFHKSHLLVVDFDCDVAVRHDVCDVEQTCLGVNFLACILLLICVGDIDLDVVAVNKNVAFASVIEVGHFVERNAARNVLFEVYVAGERRAFVIGEKDVFRAAEFVDFDVFGEVCEL